MNTDSGKLNSDSGNPEKVFTLNRNERSRSTRIGVHVEPEWAFILGRNMQQLPQEAKPRPNYAYKLRPTLRIIDADLATTFIWGSVTDERTPVAVPANPTGCKVYTYEGDMATVTPDDICEAADELDTSCDAVNNQRPLDIALVESVVVDTVETFEYQTGSLYPGTYTVALVCEDDNIEADGDLEFIGEQDVYATLPSGKGPADFVLMD